MEHAMAIYNSGAKMIDDKIGDLALKAAIEIENYKIGRHTEFENLGKLSLTLREGVTADLSLVPVYNCALTNGTSTAPENKADLFHQLTAISQRMNPTSAGELDDLDFLRDFCVALHEAALNMSLDAYMRVVVPQRDLI